MKDKFDIEDEIICEYFVNCNRKKLWVAEIEMLEYFENTCKKNLLNYYVFAGSAIGVVRHGGFIPWDDDIDMGMLREDFDKFLNCDKSDWPEYYDIQYGVSDDRVDFILRIRDSRTTGITRQEVDKKGNKGVFIEIYVFDYVEHNGLRNFQNWTNFQLMRSLEMFFFSDKNLNTLQRIRKILVKVIGAKNVWNLYEMICKLQNAKERQYVDTPSLPNYAIAGEHLYELKDVETSIYMPFEYSRIRVPIGYDKCLRVAFGDYMQLPTVEKRGTHHNTVVFYDSEKPYTFYENSDIVERYFSGEHELGKI